MAAGVVAGGGNVCRAPHVSGRCRLGGEPSAASRVLLPMQFAFNVLVPSGRWWVPVLLLGNLTLLTGHITLDPIANEGTNLRAHPPYKETQRVKGPLSIFRKNGMRLSMMGPATGCGLQEAINS